MSKHYAFETTSYYVLLALAEQSAHGLAISDQIIGDSVGGIYLRSSTLYATIKSLENDGLIERISYAEVKAHRKSYRLTERGQRRLADTAHMHERAARLAKARLGLRY
jgi:DNA-binding PadR family transcriptional regulator